jgi:hypothetical protein
MPERAQWQQASWRQERPRRGSDDPKSGATAKSQCGRRDTLPRTPGAASREEPDWITGLLQERLLGGLFQYARPEIVAGIVCSADRLTAARSVGCCCSQAGRP